MPAPGAVLRGRYRILAPLGSGGMATVHRALDERLDREVAVKVLLPNHAGDPVLAARFEREARSLAAAAHPGVVAVFDVDPGDPATGAEPFFVMELCSGGSLADRLGPGAQLAPDEIVPILISVADGLAGLHARGVVHRDVKPSNILLAPARAKLADFGVARSDGGDTSELTSPGTTVGTMGYLAPEVLAGGLAGPASDVYALGVAAFSALTGAMPRPGRSIGELVAASARAAPLVSAVAPSLGTAFDDPIAAALDGNPDSRPDAQELAARLTTALGRWSRGRPAVGAAATGADEFATTAVHRAPVAGPVPVAARRAPAPVPPTRPASPSSGRSTILVAALVSALIIGALAFASGQLGGAPRQGVGEESPSVRASESPSASPSPSVPSASPAPTPVPTPTVAERALAALDGVDAAIEEARGSDGLKNRDANELARDARSIRSSLEADDLDGALEATNELRDKVEELSDEMDDDAGERLANAVTAVLEILRDR